MSGPFAYPAPGEPRSSEPARGFKTRYNAFVDAFMGEKARVGRAELAVLKKITDEIASVAASTSASGRMMTGTFHQLERNSLSVRPRPPPVTYPPPSSGKGDLCHAGVFGQRPPATEPSPSPH